MYPDMRKAMTNNKQLYAALKKGYLDEVAQDLFRYQTIETDRNYEHDGNFERVTSFKVKHSKGFSVWEVTKVNGDVKRVGVKY
tara:strand:+ start:85523 stop:85771 length:249 start_codon:yes stop_codon:yes gene_type:complete